MTSLRSKGSFLKLYSWLPIIILFISVLNEFDFNYLNLKYFSLNFPFILIFFFTLKEFKNFDYFLGKVCWFCSQRVFYSFYFWQESLFNLKEKNTIGRPNKWKDKWGRANGKLYKRQNYSSFWCWQRPNINSNTFCHGSTCWWWRRKWRRWRRGLATHVKPSGLLDDHCF